MFVMDQNATERRDEMINGLESGVLDGSLGIFSSHSLDKKKLPASFYLVLAAFGGLARCESEQSSCLDFTLSLNYPRVSRLLRDDRSTALSPNIAFFLKFCLNVYPFNFTWQK